MFWSTVTYFLLSIGLAFAYQLYSDFPIMKQSETTKTLCFILSLVVSAGFGILGFNYIRKWKLKDKSITIDKFREWQKSEFKKKAGLDIEEEDIKEVIKDYVLLAEEKLRSLSPLIKPAFVIGFLVPTYTAYLNVASSSLHDLGLAIVAALFILLILTPLYLFSASLLKFINNEQDIYVEYLGFLNEILYDIKFPEFKS